MRSASPALKEFWRGAYRIDRGKPANAGSEPLILAAALYLAVAIKLNSSSEISEDGNMGRDEEP